ncbi:MAG: corrinoid protein [Kiritimatiellae bacterium]|nr:corrinoid protein [Kiritimatiellia bacterium]
MARLEELYTAICSGNRPAVQTILQRELAAGRSPSELLTETMIPAMRDVGERYSRRELFIPQMMIAARAMEAGLQILEPLLVKTGHEPRATICIGTVKGDLHDIGKNLVAMMLKGAGFRVIDLGTNVDVLKFEKAVNDGARAVLMSALLTTTMPYMKTVADHFRGSPGVKIIIGGAPITQEYADEIGAHGYGEDAGAAVRVVERCLGLAG